MNAGEEIQTAIDKLTRLKDASTEGPWTAWHSTRAPHYGNSSVDAPTDDPDNPYMVVEGGERADVDLIATLHATIDAQLTILRIGYGAIDPWDTGFEVITEVAHTLARAINGTTS